MTVITLVAGKKHKVKVGDTERDITVLPGEVRYEPFIREALDIPIVEPVELPKKVGPLGTVTPPPTTITYESWSSARPKPTFDDILTFVEGVRGRKDLGFTPTFSNLVSLLRKYRK